MTENKETILEVEHLRVTRGGVEILRDVGFSLKRGEVLGIAGESGCGKTTLLRALMLLTDTPFSAGHGSRGQAEGKIRFLGRELGELDQRKLRELRGGEIAMIPQNASLAMDAARTISSLFLETIRAHRQGRVTKRESDAYAAELMEKLLLEDPERILRSYPFELSGGMCQRVLIAAAMANHPKLLLGDEPTSALDTKNQQQVLGELELLKEQEQVSMILVSHNLGVLARIADTIAIMYGGKIVEYGAAEQILQSPEHPYTKALLDAVPGRGAGVWRP